MAAAAVNNRAGGSCGVGMDGGASGKQHGRGAAKTTETDATYINTVFLTSDQSGIIHRDQEVRVNVNCSYPLNMLISLDVAFQPLVSSVEINSAGTGKFTLQMASYSDLAYNSPYGGSEIPLSTNSIVYIGVMLADGDTNGFKVLMKNCYATPSSDPNDMIKYYIIRNGCPNTQDPSIKVEENGVSSKGRFSVKLFTFVGDHTLVYMHCEISVCDYATDCTPYCSGARLERVANEGSTDYQLRYGPYVNKDYNTTSINVSISPEQNGASFDISMSSGADAHASWTFLASVIMMMLSLSFP